MIFVVNHRYIFKRVYDVYMKKGEKEKYKVIRKRRRERCNKKKENNEKARFVVILLELFAFAKH